MNDQTEIQSEAATVERSGPVTVPMGPLYKALAGARGEFPDIPRTRLATIRMKSGGTYSYKYADLADVVRATAPAMSAYGLTVCQWPEGNVIKTLIGHESGAEKIFTWPIKAMPQRTLDDCQSFQSAVQVAKRYALTAALGISTEETIEGDEKGHRTLSEERPAQTDPWIEPDGIRAPVGAKVSANMSKDEMAKESARAIIEQFGAVKTEEGLNGVWRRNERFIEVFKDKYDALFQDVYDAFNSYLAAMQGDA